MTLDDISRIVAAEQARELRPNAFTHFKTLEDGSDEFNSNERKRTGVYYSELDKSALVTLKYISLSLLMSDLKNSTIIVLILRSSDSRLAEKFDHLKMETLE